MKVSVFFFFRLWIIFSLCTTLYHPQKKKMTFTSLWDPVQADFFSISVDSATHDTH